MPVKIRKFFGNRAFYAMVIAVVMPIIIQNFISNFVNLLDNLMVGRIGTDQMSGVAITNQLMLVFNITIFGAVSGAGIFAAQYHGAGNTEGVRAAFRYKLYICLLVGAVSILLFSVKGKELISLYLSDTSDPVRVQHTLDFGMQYLRIMILGLIPFALSQAYAGTLRETGETAMPMYAGIIAVFVNLIFNYLLIFGKFGFPELGVRGAAIATVLSRYVELGIIIGCTHGNKKKYAFAHGLYRSFKIPLPIVREITLKGMPLLVNELLWSLGQATLNQIYSVRGLDVVAALNISSTVYNLFGVAYLAMGSATSIIIGNTLGANDIETAKDYARKLLTTAVMVGMAIGVILATAAPFIPLLYNTGSAIHTLATKLILVCCAIMPVHSYVHTSYFTIRSGGKTGITFLFDCVFSWAVVIPVAYIFTHFTPLAIVGVYICVQSTEFLKALIGFGLIKKGVWINNIVSGENMQAV